jgi:hypothetical protein
MIEVYIWLPKKVGNQKNVGHASMLVGGHTYISWWPDSVARLGHNFHPIRNKNYKSDVRDEGCVPDGNILLKGLNEKAILDWWQQFGLTRGSMVFQGPLPPYNLAKQNCSSVVAQALKKGGGDSYANWYNSWSVIWRPRTVLDYALAIERELDSLPRPKPAAPLLSEADYQNAAVSLGVEVAVIKAVSEVESRGHGFDAKGRPKILFEAHWFHKFTNGEFDSEYPHLSQPTWALGKKYYSLDQWQRMNEAMALALEEAWKSASWGKFQVMGFNHSGWTKVRDFVFAMFESEAQHLKSFLAYCRDSGLVSYLKKKEWAAFARGYNGEGYAANQYDVKLKAAYEKYKK